VRTLTKRLDRVALVLEREAEICASLAALPEECRARVERAMRTAPAGDRIAMHRAALWALPEDFRQAVLACLEEAQC
jgi:hypothetical protein